MTDGRKKEKKYKKNTHPKRKKGREKKTTFAFGWTRSSDQYRVLRRCSRTLGCTLGQGRQGVRRSEKGGRRS